MEITINGKTAHVQNITPPETIVQALDKLKLGECLNGSGMWERFKITKAVLLTHAPKWDKVNSLIVNGKRIYASKKTISELVRQHQ